MIWIALIVLCIAGFIWYKISNDKPVKKYYVLSELQDGDRIMVTHGFSDSVAIVMKNYPNLKQIVIKIYDGSETLSYSHYRFINWKDLEKN
jgi:preprotein translocase subunit YajC